MNKYYKLIIFSILSFTFILSASAEVQTQTADSYCGGWSKENCPGKSYGDTKCEWVNTGAGTGLCKAVYQIDTSESHCRAYTSRKTCNGKQIGDDYCEWVYKDKSVGGGYCQVREPIGANFCSDIKSTLSFIGYIIIIGKILVPFLIIIVGGFDLLKAVQSGKSEDVKKEGIILGKRVIIGVMIFLVPTLLKIVIGSIKDKSSTEYNNFVECSYYLLNPTETNNKQTEEDN